MANPVPKYQAAYQPATSISQSAGSIILHQGGARFARGPLIGSDSSFADFKMAVLLGMRRKSCR